MASTRRKEHLDKLRVRIDRGEAYLLQHTANSLIKTLELEFDDARDQQLFEQGWSRERKRFNCIMSSNTPNRFPQQAPGTPSARSYHPQDFGAQPPANGMMSWQLPTVGFSGYSPGFLNQTAMTSQQPIANPAVTNEAEELFASFVSSEDLLCKKRPDLKEVYDCSENPEEMEAMLIQALKIPGLGPSFAIKTASNLKAKAIEVATLHSQMENLSDTRILDLRRQLEYAEKVGAGLYDCGKRARMNMTVSDNVEKAAVAMNKAPSNTGIPSEHTTPLETITEVPPPTPPATNTFDFGFPSAKQCLFSAANTTSFGGPTDTGSYPPPKSIFGSDSKATTNHEATPPAFHFGLDTTYEPEKEEPEKENTPAKVFTGRVQIRKARTPKKD